jgi:hypothetical protein
MGFILIAHTLKSNDPTERCVYFCGSPCDARKDANRSQFVSAELSALHESNSTISSLLV